MPYARGWAMVGMTAAVQFMSVGIGYYTFGVFLKPLTADLDADRFLVSLTASFQTVLMAVLGPWFGRLLADGPLRVYMTMGVLLISAGLVLSSQATTLWHLYVGFGLVLSPGLVLTGMLPNNILLANWFTRRRGAAMGISQFGVSISGTLLVPLATWLVLAYSWRTTFLIFAAITPVLLVPLIWRYAVRTPQEVGLNPDGADQPLPRTAADDDTREWTFRRAIGIRDVWLLAFIVGPSFMGVGAIVVPMHSHVTDLGMTPERAAQVVAVTTLFGAIAKPLFGTLADYMNKRLVVAMSIALQVSGVTMFLFADTLSLLAAAGVLFGLGYGSTAPMWGILLAERFGAASFSRVMGAVMPMTMPFTLVALPFTTFVFEATGSYLPAFATMLAGYALAAVCLWQLKLPARPGSVI